MSGDKTLYALAEENNRMLRALSRDMGILTSSSETLEASDVMQPCYDLSASLEPFRAKVRDAALEEAALRIQGARDWVVAAGFIRALKSEFATESISAFAALEALQRAGMQRGAEKWERGEMDGPTPEPVHDFGWALACMREGKRVRRSEWPASDAWFCVRADDGTFWFRGSVQKFTPEATLATDWQVVE